MKKQIIGVFAIALALSTVACKDAKNETEGTDAKAVAEVTAEAVKYKVDADASTIRWVGKKPTGEHSGTIAIESGVVNVDGDNVSGTFLIDMTSIEVTDLKPGEGKEDLESHLKGTSEGKEDHFFNVAQYPTAAFEVTGITEKDGMKMLQGNLTIKGIKKNIEFPVEMDTTSDMMGIRSKAFTIDRTDWNVNYNSKSVFENLGDKFINDDIQLQVTLKATKA
ncbi:YceI family protein [Dokdonia sinensis]|uniref:YceI family protein n=1 Tax=Dokdonia sinensis TaxID=2479847 RepID=A0A3M0FW28_9FLAO|nr:YceI family protein [Dokdonia sinensis]RMB56167.1 YceI family protein [Dokdonia sinensis]